MALRGEPMALQGGCIALRGKVMALKGEPTALRGDVIALRGKDVAPRGELMAPRGKDAALKGRSAALRGHSVMFEVRRMRVQVRSVTDQILPGPRPRGFDAAEERITRGQLRPTGARAKREDKPQRSSAGTRSSDPPILHNSRRFLSRNSLLTNQLFLGPRCMASRSLFARSSMRPRAAARSGRRWWRSEVRRCSRRA